MYSTKGIEHVASVTELRTNTIGLIDHANALGEGILIARNNKPQGVLIGLTQYEEYLALKQNAGQSAHQDAS